MNARLHLTLKAIHLTGFLINFSFEDESSKFPEGLWSNELNQRLIKQSCKAGEIQQDMTLLHKLRSGRFLELGHVHDIEVCVLQCCENRECELALFKDRLCYGINCYSSQHCKTAPAYRPHDRMAAVFVSKTKHNVTKHDTSDSKSSNKKHKSKPRNFVFYPSDNSNNVAFSVNLQTIARHYIDNKNVRNALNAKANEYFTGVKHFTAKGFKHVLDNNIKQKTSERMETFPEWNINKPNDMNRNVSKSHEFSSRNHSHLLLGSWEAQSGKHIETLQIKTKKKHRQGIEWTPHLLKAIIPSSSVAILIVLLALLTLTGQKE